MFYRNRTLEEIESHFSDKTKKITDRNIAKINSKQSDDEENGNKNNQTEKSNNVNDKTNGLPVQNEYDNRGFVNDI